MTEEYPDVWRNLNLSRGICLSVSPVGVRVSSSRRGPLFIWVPLGLTVHQPKQATLNVMPARFWLGMVSFHLSMVSRLLKCKYWRQRGNVNTMVGLPDFNFGDNIQSWVHEIGTQEGRKKVVGAADNGRSGQDQSVSHTIHSPQQLVYVCVCMGDAIFLLSVIMNMSDRRQVNHVEGMTTPSTGEQGEL